MGSAALQGSKNINISQSEVSRPCTKEEKLSAKEAEDIRLGMGDNVELVSPGRPIDERVTLTKADIPNLTLIGVGGPTRAGKGTLTKGLMRHWKSVEIICMDYFFHPSWMPVFRFEGRESYNWETPRGVDWVGAAKKIKSLEDGTPKVVIIDGFLLTANSGWQTWSPPGFTFTFQGRFAK